MSTNALPPPGTFCWLTIPVTDVARAAAFYNAVLGWTCLHPSADQGTPSPHDPEVTTHMFTHAETLHGAFLRVPSASRIADTTKGAASVVASFAVENVGEALAKAVEKGGKVHTAKTDIGNGRGYYAQFVDSEGNVQGLWGVN